ncbi:hypothetical protein ACIGXA_17590 [Streptomyces fildesensis]|uniref:Uncharacterized protein n=1 Tax=Streptomyces fildesensis TaxID=375757 RepID=A0ABW8C8A7_9ACTN
MSSAISTFTLSLLAPVPHAPAPHCFFAVRPLIDGRDVVEEFFPDGLGAGPRKWFRTDGPLAATADPHEVRLAEDLCGAGCCGELSVTIRREGDHVLWADWQNTGDNGRSLPDVRFDAAQYDAELHRAAHDRSWERPADAVARLLDDTLRREADWFARWECDVDGVYPASDDPGWVDVYFHHSPRPWLRFGMRLPVTATEPAQVQADRLAAQVMTGDPRQAAGVRGV